MLDQARAAANGGQSSRSRSRNHFDPDVADDEDAIPPPAYNGQRYGDLCSSAMGGMEGTKASLTDDGRINIEINQSSLRLSSLLVPALRSQLDHLDTTRVPPPYVPPSLGGDPSQLPLPPLNVVIHVVGSRGDVQPFVALGKVLKERYGHRVRLATHPVFADFVRENGLEFFSIGGDPAELMAFMVKNPGLMPGFDTIRNGDVGKRRKEIATMVKGCWRSCIEAGDGLGPEANDKTQEDWMSVDSSSTNDAFSNINPKDKPFVADAIIANPPSFAHIHCAEKLGCPLHIMFTMPYSPTQAFPHPLANIKSTNTDPHLANFITYALVDMLTWQGLGDIINRFRQKSLNLEPISLMWAPGMLARMRVPHTYCWSPALIPKPKDWGNHITIAGFYMLNLATNFTPEPALKAFLDAGPPPVYIGFGSIVLDDPNGMTNLIFEAVRKTGQRALVSKGWGGFGGDELDVPESVYMLGNVPHDWLFQHVSCVVHHGGAGTTAAGIAHGRPTVIVPFFGDQPFWGSMVAKAGAGPEPIPHKELTADKLTQAITTALKPESLERAHELADQIRQEQGTEDGSQYFHQFLDIDKMRCLLAPRRAAVWRVKRTDVGLSALAATTLANEGLLHFKDLKLFRSREYETDDGPWDPISGSAGAIIGTISTMMMGFADFPVAAMKAIKVYPDGTKKEEAKPDGTTTPDERSSRDLRRESTDSQSRSRSQVVSGTSTPTEAVGSSVKPSPASTFNLNESFAKIGASGSNTPRDASASGERRTSSMANALRDQLGEPIRSQSPSTSGASRSRSRASSSTGRPGSPDSGREGKGSRDMMATLDDVLKTGEGVSKIVSAGFKSPMDFTHGLAKGFHNAPKLYGDNVRKSEPITDFRSGLMAAGKGFGYGFYDGITGLVTQPLEGAKKEGAAGFVKGFGKGIGGIVFKPGAAIFGIPAYTMKGVYQELQQHLGSSVQNYIIAARTAQGYDEWRSSTQEEREDIIRNWDSVRNDLKKKKNPQEQLQDMIAEQRLKARTRRDSDIQETTTGNDSRSIRNRRRTNSRSASGNPNLLIRLRDALDYQSGRSIGSEGASFRDAASRPALNTSTSAVQRPSITLTDTTTGGSENALQHANTAPSQMQVTTEADLHRSIMESVAESSRGNAEEDALIARAIRASILELSARPPDYTETAADEEEHYRSALAASMAEAERYARAHPGGQGADDDELAKAIQASLENAEQSTRPVQTSGTDNEWDTGANDEIREEDLMRAISASRLEQEQQEQQRQPQQKQQQSEQAQDDPPAYYPDEKGLGEVMQASAAEAEAARKQDEEERIVMEYIKKQSLQEEEHRKEMVSKGKQSATSVASGNNVDEDDEALQRAIKLSMSQGGKNGGESSK
ncbi:hypothetical protein AAFC00_000671 [Neodothiora populina]